MLRHSLLQNYQNSPDKVCCPFPQRWTSVGSAGCNTARLQVTQGHQSQHGLTVQGNAAFPWGTSQGASAGTQQLPQGPSDALASTHQALSASLWVLLHMGFPFPSQIHRYVCQTGFYKARCIMSAIPRDSSSPDPG